VNVVLAVLLLTLGVLVLGSSWITQGAVFDPLASGPSLASLLGLLLWGNITLALFNMLPAFPMDGGRVLRALLSFALGRPRATRVAATIGQVMAAGLGALGLLGDQSLTLVLIGLFVFFGATQERSSGQLEEALSGIVAGEACDPHAITLAPGELVGATFGRLMASAQYHFAVVQAGEVLGTLSRRDLLREVHREGYVAAVMQGDPVVVDVSTPLIEVRRLLQETEGRPLLVSGPEGLMGILGMEDIQRVGAVAGASRAQRAFAKPATGGVPLSS